MASINPLYQPGKRWKTDTSFHPLSPSCFKQISCFQGLSYAAQDPQPVWKLLTRQRKAEESLLHVVFSLLTRGIWHVWSGQCWEELQKAPVRQHSEHVTAQTRVSVKARWLSCCIKADMAKPWTLGVSWQIKVTSSMCVIFLWCHQSSSQHLLCLNRWWWSNAV